MNRNNLLPIGTEIYYTGDMANHPGKGTVKAHHKNAGWSEVMDIEIKGEWDTFTESYTEDREFKGLGMAHFAPGPGRRFWTLKEWKEDQGAKLDAMQKSIQDNPIISAELSREIGDIKF